MTSHRINFLEAFAKSTPALNLIFLNHSGAPSKLLNDITSIDLLADKKATSDFVAFCETHPLVIEIHIHPMFGKTEVVVELVDRSEIKFHLIRSMVRKALYCLPVSSIRKDAFVNEFHMLVASHAHHFEYLFLNCQFAGMPLPDRYKNYYSGFDFASRTSIFRYIQPRYDLVINNLDDLYQPKAGIVLSIMVALRKEKENSLFKMMLRTLEYGFFNLFGFITKKVSHLHPSKSGSTEISGQRNNRTAGQVVL
ncbi:MAG: hypothetical protein IPP71_07490 [Bacteroidetes bacterium]|nr:hypothetical protein [Bacteroidota bacterium]